MFTDVDVVRANTKSGSAKNAISPMQVMIKLRELRKSSEYFIVLLLISVNSDIRRPVKREFLQHRSRSMDSCRLRCSAHRYRQPSRRDCAAPPLEQSPWWCCH